MRDAGEVTTRKLYDEDAYATAFSAEVLSAEEDDLVLDRTLFFPEEGGQIPDLGILAGRKVRDVQIIDGTIHHFLEHEEGAALPNIGETVTGEIDWARRFSNMQQHAGEHLVSGIVHRRLGLENTGFHLSEREVTMDYNGPIDAETLAEIELEANRAVTANLESIITFTTREERAGLEYRSKLELDGIVRLVEYPGIDLCACCAPHVRRTGEIGLIKIIGCAAYKGGVRVNILCGERALKYLSREHELINAAAAYLTTSADQVLPQIEKMKAETAALRGQIRELSAKVLEKEAETLDPEAKNVCLFTEETDQNAARGLINRLIKEHSGYCALFSGTDETGYRFLIGAGAGADAREAAATLRGQFGAKGGGNREMVQGSVKAEAGALRAIFL